MYPCPTLLPGPASPSQHLGHPLFPAKASTITALMKGGGEEMICALVSPLLYPLLRVGEAEAAGLPGQWLPPSPVE